MASSEWHEAIVSNGIEPVFERQVSIVPSVTGSTNQGGQ